MGRRQCQGWPMIARYWTTIKDQQDKQTFNPGSNLSAISTVVFKVLSVLHFSVRVMPRSFTWPFHDQILDSRFSGNFPSSQFTLYLVSRLPATFPLSMLEDPPDVNSTPVSVLVLTYTKICEEHHVAGLRENKIVTYTSSLRRPKW